MTSLQVLRLAFCVTFSTVLLISCEKNPEAKQLLKEIQADYEAGNYQRVIYSIDSMRHYYPDAVEERREALKFHQEASLKMAQANLAEVDSALQAAIRQFDEMKPQVEAHRKACTATKEELQQFNELRAYRDSLQGVFNLECAKIKYIHKRQKELTKDK